MRGGMERWHEPATLDTKGRIKMLYVEHDMASQAYKDGYAAGFNGEHKRHGQGYRPDDPVTSAFDRGYADGCKALEFEKSKPNTAAAYCAFAYDCQLADDPSRVRDVDKI